MDLSVIILPFLLFAAVFVTIYLKRRSEEKREELAGCMRVVRDLSILNELSSSLHTVLDRESVLEMVVDKTKELLKAEKAAMVLIDKHEKITDFYSSLGPTGGCKVIATGVIRKVFRELATVRTEDIDSVKAFSGFSPSHPEMKSMLMVPVILRGEAIGVLMAADKLGSTGFSSKDEDLLLNLAFHSALSVEKVRFHEEILMMASTDGLTGLNNHRAFQDKLKEEMERARRFGHKVSLLMIDIDHFKGFNDTYGHINGDEILKRISCLISDNIRAIDFAARYGGEEFAVILPEVALSGAHVVAERIRSSTEKHKIKIRDEKVNVTISVGIATYPDDAITSEDFIDRADKALYLAKRTGRNKVCDYSEREA